MLSCEERESDTCTHTTNAMVVPTDLEPLQSLTISVVGPIVRISPTEVSLADIQSARTIYKVGGPYLKSEWYDTFTGNQNARNLFTMTNPHQHGHHRRLTAFNFSEKWIANLEPFIARNVQKASLRMDEESKMKGYFDAFKWFMFMVGISLTNGFGKQTAS